MKAFHLKLQDLSCQLGTTEKQYKTYLDKWTTFCNSTGIDPISPPLNVAINFLADIAETVGHSAVNTARSPLSCIIQLPNGKSFGNMY